MRPTNPEQFEDLWDDIEVIRKFGIEAIVGITGSRRERLKTYFEDTGEWREFVRHKSDGRANGGRRYYKGFRDAEGQQTQF